MCLVVVALNAHPRYSLVVAANRDESHARAARPAQWGDAAPFVGVLAGRDLTAGGTWLGVRRDGRWALLTNVRAGGRHNPYAPSRGDLVPTLLNAASAPGQALAALLGDAGPYNGFNVIAGDAGSATWGSNRAAEVRPLTAGVHGLSNAELDTPWPKVSMTRSAVGAWAKHGDDDFAPLFAALAERTIASDATLPSTGVSLEWERLLSAPFIVSPDYGTRCSTVFAIDRRGTAHFVERSFDALGAATDEVDITFDVSPSP